MTPTNPNPEPRATAAVDPSAWRVATVAGIRDDARGVKTFTFTFAESLVHMPGQHYEIRLTAPNGYHAARLYSAASLGDGRTHELELTIALMPDGEVSPYLHQHVQPGDQLELRGPLGRYFVWQPSQPEPILLVGGGTGVVPLRAMLLAHAAAQSTTNMNLLYSARDLDLAVYPHELLGPRPPHQHVRMTLTDQHPADWTGDTRRIDPAMLHEELDRLGDAPTCYVCGSTPFVEAVTDQLVIAGVPIERIRAERFGSTG